MEILVNQLGYERDGPKRAVCRATERHEIDRFTLHDGDSVVFEGAPEFVGEVADWGEWVFWTLDFSTVTAAGEYTLRIDDTRSRRFEIGDDLHGETLLSDLLYYFRTQRSSGRYDRADRAIPFVGDREGTVDVRGGWYDASGDTSKYLSHLSYANYFNPQQIPIVAWGLADARDRLHAADHTLGEELDERLREEIHHGADFLVRMQDDEGYFYMTVFDQWSKDVARREICAYETQEGHKTDEYESGYRQGGGVAIAALARASQVEGPGEFDRETYHEAAMEGFDHLEAHNTEYLDDGVENVIDDYCALLAATELTDATGEERFVEAARERARSLLDRQSTDDSYDGWFEADDDGRPFFHAADEGLPVVALLRHREVDPDGPLTDGIAAAVQRFWDFETGITDEVANPFGYPRQYVQAVDEAEPSDSFFFPHENETGYWWQGENARIASLATAAVRSRDLVDEDTAARLDRFAQDQLDWILGSNPFGVCMVHGVGAPEPTYHRSYRNVPGGIQNGITAGVENEADVAYLPEGVGDDHAHRWRWAEQWLPHAAWAFLAVSSL